MVRGLPPPRPQDRRPGAPPAPATRPRPIAMTISILMTVVASIEWIFAVLIVWLFIATGLGVLDTEDLAAGGLYRMMSTAHHRLTQGLAIPLLILPVAAIVMAVLMLYRKPAMRIMYTALGVLTAGFAIWWLRTDWWWWAFALLHTGICLALVWVPSSSAWYDDEVPAGDGG